MEDVLWYRKPLLSEPVAVLAFEGWSDAGNTASGCVENLSGTFDIEPFAELNSEGFYNYQMRRPLVEVKDVGQREFHWPQTSFYSIEDYKLKNDLILVFGEEPSMKWKTYSENISNTLFIKFAESMEIFFPIFHLGCFIAEDGFFCFKDLIELFKKGPPEAVKIISCISLLLQLLVNCMMEKCSESTG